MLQPLMEFTSPVTYQAGKIASQLPFGTGGMSRGKTRLLEEHPCAAHAGHEFPLNSLSRLATTAFTFSFASGKSLYGATELALLLRASSSPCRQAHGVLC